MLWNRSFDSSLQGWLCKGWNRDIISRVSISKSGFISWSYHSLLARLRKSHLISFVPQLFTCKVDLKLLLFFCSQVQGQVQICACYSQVRSFGQNGLSKNVICGFRNFFFFFILMLFPIWTILEREKIKRTESLKHPSDIKKKKMETVPVQWQWLFCTKRGGLHFLKRGELKSKRSGAVAPP